MITPSLPYPDADGSGTEGWAGSDTSHDRAITGRKSATKRQQMVIWQLQMAGHTGMTWFELGDTLRWHHGRASGVLSVLHKDDRISRLKEKRGRSAVYVLHHHVDGREVAAPGRTKSNMRDYEQGYADGLRDGRRGQ